jgi:putative monooxygenase
LKIPIIDPFHDVEPTWLGVDEPGLRRKVWKVVGAPSAPSQRMTAGVTIFEPGEASAYHVHANSDEVIYVLRGSGVVRSENEERPFSAGVFMFNPAGVPHQHVNTGTEPLWVIFVYSPPGDLPS